MRHIQSVRGATNRTAVLLSTTTITTPGATTYTLPTGTQYLDIELWGAGGGGGGGITFTSARSTVGAAGGGGAGGEYVRERFYGNGFMQSGDVLNLVVGRGGTAGIRGGQGVAGGNTQLLSHQRNGVTLSNNGITHDSSAADAPVYGIFYSISAYGGAFGRPGAAGVIGGYAGINSAVAWDIEQADVRVGGPNGTTGYGSSAGGNGGTGGAGASGGAGGTPGITAGGGVQAGTGTIPGAGGGGGFYIGTTTIGSGGTGAAGQIVIKAYG